MNQKDRTLQELSSNEMHNRSQFQRNFQNGDDFIYDEMPNGAKGHHHMQSVQEGMGFHSTINQGPKMNSHNYNTRHAGQAQHAHHSSVQIQGNFVKNSGLQRKSSKQLLINSSGSNNMTMTQNLQPGFASSRHMGGPNSQQRGYRNTRNGMKSTSNSSQVQVNYNTTKATSGVQAVTSQVMQSNPSHSNFFGQGHRSSRGNSREPNQVIGTQKYQPVKKSATLKSQILFKQNNQQQQRNGNTSMNSNSKNPAKSLRTMSKNSNRFQGNENEQIKSHRKFQLENGGDIQNQAVKVPKMGSQVQQLSKVKITNEDLLNGLCMNGMNHPSRMLCRKIYNDFQRQNINVRSDLSEDIDNYLRHYQHEFDIKNCLQRHKITPTLRARMIDWMIEVLTNFKCDDQTFFLAVSLQDRFSKGCDKILEVGDLHVLGVTAMFVASKFEDIYPLKMKTVHEKIAHSKLDIERIKELELEIMKVIKYKIHAPTVLDFLKVYLLEALDITIQCKTITKKKEEEALASNSIISSELQEESKEHSENELKVQQYLIEKMTVYLAKMSMHDVDLCAKPPSLLAVGAIYVALKICEQLKRKDLINSTVVTKLIQVSHQGEDEILEVSQKVLYLAQNFDQEFPSLENLKKTHFGVITQLLCDERYQHTGTDLI